MLQKYIFFNSNDYLLKKNEKNKKQNDVYNIV